MFFHKREDKSFVAVAMTMILIGAAIVAFGLVGWLVNVSNADVVIVFPSMKIIGGFIIIALGYIQLELGLLRKK
jgi:hypothetical protein